MAFDVAQFSNDGLDLLAQISSSKALRTKNVYLSETDYTGTPEVINESPTWWLSATASTMAKVEGNVEVASSYLGAGSEQARLIIKMNLKSGQTTTVRVKTIILTACGVESGIETSEVTFIGLLDDNGIDVVKNDSLTIDTRIAVEFTFDQSSSITLEDGSDPDYVIHSELDRLMSCHVVGDTTTGEAQTILGNKWFEGLIGASVVTNNLNTTFFELQGINDELTTPITTTVRIGANPSIPIGGGVSIMSSTGAPSWIFDANGILYSTSPTNLGKSTAKLANVYATNLGTASSQATSAHSRSFESHNVASDITTDSKFDYDNVLFTTKQNSSLIGSTNIEYSWNTDHSQLRFYIDETQTCTMKPGLVRVDADLQVDGDYIGALPHPSSIGSLIKVGEITVLKVISTASAADSPEISRGMVFYRPTNVSSQGEWWYAAAPGAESAEVLMGVAGLNPSDLTVTQVSSELYPANAQFMALNRAESQKAFLAMRIA